MKLITALCLCFLLIGCTHKETISLRTFSTVSSSAELKTFPELGQAKEIEPGVLFYEVLLTKQKNTTKLWIYLPKQQQANKLPCIIIAPAGSRLFHGMNLVEEDRHEHIPYVRAGYAVIAYEIDGALENDASNTEIIDAIAAFKNAEAGLVNARFAIDYALTKLPQIDVNRIYSAGHSSAGTLSLLIAEREPRVKASIAYAPVTNVTNRLGDEFITAASKYVHGFREFIVRSSPDTEPKSLKHPLFLFHAEDDNNVPIADSISFVEEVKKTNTSVVFVRAQTGNHYNSMIREGIPQAIQWLDGID